MKKKTSEVYRSDVTDLLDHVYAKSQRGCSRSWSKLNNTLRMALEIAIGGGFKWDIDDCKYVVNHYNSGYWLGENFERWYSLCIAASNASAIASYESYVGRQGFIADNVTPTECSLSHMTGDRVQERIGVGFKFLFQGKRVICNSFGPDGTYLNATEYFGYSSTPRTDKPKRFKITREMIIADRAERKERKEIELKLTEFADQSDRMQPESKMAAKILKSLGVKKRSELDSLPIEKLRSVAEKYLGKTTKETK